jgi:hypothetical protein
MPAHSSHILQPLDVSCFGPLKRAYGNQVEKQMRLGINHITKEDFLSMYYEAHKQAITTSNICSGFTATGLVPFEPEHVLSQLSLQIRTPSPVISIVSLWESQTPHDITAVQKQVNYIKEQRKARRNISKSPSDEALKKLVKGCAMAMQSGAILHAENKALRIANRRQTQKRKQRRSNLGKKRVMTIAEAQDMMDEREVEQQFHNEAPKAPTSAPPEPVRTKAPPRCSVCYSFEHTARTCPTRYPSTPALN